jgi:SLAP domain-containing protein
MTKENNVDGNITEKVELSLSLHPKWNVEMSTDDKYKLAFLHTQLGEVDPNKVTLRGYKANYEGNDQLKVSFFVRNATTRPAKVGEIPLTVINEGMKVIASGRFNLDEIEEIPPMSSRPWEVTFKGKALFNKNEVLNKWKLSTDQYVPEQPPKGYLDINKRIFQSLSDREIENLTRTANSLPEIPPGRVQLVPININKTKENEVSATTFIRNGLQTKVNVGYVKLVLMDKESEKEITSKVFNLTDLSVKAGATKPWIFNFSLENASELEMDKLTVVGAVEGLKIVK